jgi:Spy/CpxP family protein refolding chaperone
MRKIAIPLTVLIALLVTSSFASAVSGGRGAGNFNGKGQRGQVVTYEQHKVQMENRLERMGVILDLSSKQKDQLRNLFDQQWEERQAQRHEMQSSRDAMHSARWNKNFNEKEFRAQAQKHADLKTEMMVQRAKIRQQALAILTPEQQQKAEKLQGMGGRNFFGSTDNCRGHGNHGGGNGQRYMN